MPLNLASFHDRRQKARTTTVGADDDKSSRDGDYNNIRRIETAVPAVSLPAARNTGCSGGDASTRTVQ